MRGTYRCTNVKFCMEDENQRRAWEYLHGLNRRDGSYGKVLADALIAVIGSQSNSQNAMRKRFSGKQCEDSGDEIKEFANKVAEVVLEGITDYFADKAVFKVQNKEMMKRKYLNKIRKRRLQKICWILLFQWESKVQKNRG